MTDCLSPVFVRAVSAGGALRLDRALSVALGLSEAEVGRKPFLDWIHPDDVQTAAEAIGAGEGEMTARHATRSGDWLSFVWKVRAHGGGGYVLGRLASTASVSADRGPNERRGNRTINEMLASMARIVEGKNPGKLCSILLVDRESRRVTVGAGPSLPEKYNAAVEGLEIGPAVGSCGTAAYWNVPVIVEDIQRDPLWKDLRTVAAIAGVAACWSHPIRSTDGEVLGAMALYDTIPGAPTREQMDGLEIAAHMVGLAIERDRLEAQLRHATKMEALGVLAGGVAHDFNNLLSVIVGSAELARAQIQEGEDIGSELEDILAASDSAAELCSQMLAYAGKSPLTPETVDFSALVRDLTKLLRVSLSKKANLRLDLEEGLFVRADRSQVRQVVLNLITNAAEAVGNRSGDVAVSVRAATIPTPVGPRDGVELRVRDTGPGMSDDVRGRIFDPFFSTKDEGRGLGLAAVKGILDAHGWEIRVRAEPGKGSTFSVLAPRELAPVPASVSEPEAEARTSARILAVDDEPGVLEIVTRMLEQAGMEVEAARSGGEAIELFRRDPRRFDCVLLDLNLPDRDGGEVFAELLKIRPEVRVVFASGFAEQEVLERFDGRGLAGVLQKPVRRKLLLRKIREAMRR